jgi:uncharacterized phage protein gp47/JayE
MRVRTVDEVVEDIRGELIRLRSEMAPFLKFSNLYALFRAVSSVITEQDAKIQNLSNEAFIYTATKDFLDRKAMDYGILRLDGTKAVGSILIKGPRTTIPKGLILDTPNQYLQYETIESTTSFNDVEIPIRIMSLARTSQANLPSGTRLYTSLFPSHSFTVGAYRDGSSVAQRGFTGGSELETDDEFRDRILSIIKGPNTGTISAIRNSLKTLPFLERVYIEEHSPVSGYFTVATDITDLENINQMKELINQIKPIGISYKIRTLSSQIVDINIRLKLNSLSQTSTIDSQIKTNLRTLNRVFIPNQSLTKDMISGIVLQVPGVQGLDILAPIYDVTPSNGNLLQIDKVDINFYT